MFGNYRNYRITRHVIEKMIARGIAADEDEAYALIRATLSGENAGSEYESRLKHHGRRQSRIHLRSHPQAALILDHENRSIPTIYLSRGWEDK